MLLTFLPRQLDPAGTVSASPPHIENPVLLTGKPKPQSTKADGIPMGRAKMSRRHKNGYGSFRLAFAKHRPTL